MTPRDADERVAAAQAWKASLVAGTSTSTAGANTTAALCAVIDRITNPPPHEEKRPMHRVIVCRDCPGTDDENAKTFPTEQDRDFWQAGHTKKTGHTTFHTVDQVGAP